MRNSTYNLSILKSISVALLFVCACLPFSVSAFFGDIETSQENTLSAHSLDLAIVADPVTDDARTVTATNVGETPLLYGIRVQETSDPLASFCDDVLVSHQGGAATPLLSTVFGQEALAPAAAAAHTFEFVFDPDTHTGETCVFSFVYEAHQNGYVHGEAFFDTETDTVTLTGTAATVGGVVLNEVLANPEGSDGQNGLQGEWVELYNNGDTPVNLTNWYITDLNAIHTRTIVPANTWNGQTIINPHGWLVLFMNGEVLNNSGDTVTLYNAAGIVQDVYAFGDHGTDADSDSNHTGGGDNDNPSGDETAGNEGKSDARIPDGTGPWIDPVPTPGAPNTLEEEEETFEPIITTASLFSFSSEAVIPTEPEPETVEEEKMEDIAPVEPVEEKKEENAPSTVPDEEEEKPREKEAEEQKKEEEPHIDAPTSDTTTL